MDGWMEEQRVLKTEHEEEEKGEEVKMEVDITGLTLWFGRHCKDSVYAS